MNKIYQAIIYCTLLYFFTACQEDNTGKLYLTTEQLQISDYLSDREDMTSMTDLLRRSGNFNLLNSYGNYTVFAPTNEAWNRYLTSIGKNSIAELSEEDCKNLFDFHVLFSGVNLKAQKTGLLTSIDTTMSGIQHHIDLSGGFNDIVMNKISRVQGLSELPNGFVYPVSEVFVPRPANIFDYLQMNGYTIFAQAVEAVGMKDTLQQLNIPYYPGSMVLYNSIFSIFAEPDAVFHQAGITTLEQLNDAVWAQNQSEDSSPKEALKKFVTYHILHSQATRDMVSGGGAITFNVSVLNMFDGRRLTNSLFQAANLSTLAKSKVISVSASSEVAPDPVLNENVTLNLLKSDVAFKNGVLHELNNILYPENKAQPQTLVYECEETYRYVFTRTGGKYQMFDVQHDTLRTKKNFDSNVSYSSSFYNAQNMGYAFMLTTAEKGGWVDFYLRNLPAGNYEVYLNYRRLKNNTSQKTNVYFRKASEDFNWKEQLFFSGLDMAYDKASAEDDRIGRYPEFNQNVKLGIIKAAEFSDYIFRFVHTDKRQGYYDNIILKPVNSEDI